MSATKIDSQMEASCDVPPVAVKKTTEEKLAIAVECLKVYAQFSRKAKNVLKEIEDVYSTTSKITLYP